jgi:hypothetical protein
MKALVDENVYFTQQKDALDSQSQVIKFTSCLPVVGGSLRLLPPLKTGRHDIAEILALNTKNQSIKSININKTNNHLSSCSLEG